MMPTTSMKSLLLAVTLSLAGLAAHGAVAAPPPYAAAAPKTESIQFSLFGQWAAGETHNLTDLPGLPRSFAIPDGASLVIRYVSCNALVDPGTTAYIHLIVEDTDGAQLALIPTASSEFSPGSEDRIAATVSTEIYLGINPSIGPAAGNEITLFGQREEPAIVNGLLSCNLAGELTN